MLHDANSTSQATTSVAAAFILQKEVQDGVIDCRFGSRLSKMRLFKTHIRNIYVAYIVRPPQASGEYFVPLATNAETIRGSNFDIINLKTKLAYITIARGQQVSDQLTKLEQNLCEIKADLLRTKINDAIGNQNR